MFIVTIIAIAIGVAASIANILWLVISAGVLALAGAYAQYRETLPFEWCFPSDAWKGAGSDFHLVVPRHRHGKRGPTATVFLGEPPKFEQIMCDVSTTCEGEVILGASKPFSGKLVVK